MTKLSKRTPKLIDQMADAVEVPAGEEVPTAIAVREQKQIITQTAKSLGIELSPSEIKAIVKDAEESVRANAIAYKEFARRAIAAYIDRINQQNQNDLAEIGETFVNSLNESNRQFEEGVRQTFRSVAEGVAEANRTTATTLKDWESALNNGTFWD